MSQEVPGDSHEATITHPDRVLFPEDGITKQELADYFAAVAEVMIPHTRGRPMTLQCFPRGIDQPGYFRKEASPHLPGWVETATFPLKDENGDQRQVLCNSPATLRYLANQDCITHHVWLSRADRLEHPDRLIFDLDPPDEDEDVEDVFDIVRFAAKTIRVRLQGMGLPAFAMTTGSKGLHIVVPLDRSADFETVRAWAKNFAEKMAWSIPDSFTTELRKESRGGRLLIDYTRNAYGQTGVAPYTVRAKKGAPVATPLSWEELDDIKSAREYNIRNMGKRLAETGDPWRDIGRHAVALKPQK